jgi:hypothetical protein
VSEGSAIVNSLSPFFILSCFLLWRPRCSPCWTVSPPRLSRAPPPPAPILCPLFRFFLALQVLSVLQNFTAEAAARSAAAHAAPTSQFEHLDEASDAVVDSIPTSSEGCAALTAHLHSIAAPSHSHVSASIRPLHLFVYERLMPSSIPS